MKKNSSANIESTAKLNRDVLFVAFERNVEAEKYRQSLLSLGYGEGDVYKISEESDLEPEQFQTEESPALPGAVAGAAGFGATGAAVCGVGALMAGGLAASPLFAALGGCAAAATYGSLATSIYADSQPERIVEELKEQVREGKVVIGARVQNTSDRTRIEQLSEHGTMLGQQLPFAGSA